MGTCSEEQMRVNGAFQAICGKHKQQAWYIAV